MSLKVEPREQCENTSYPHARPYIYTCITYHHIYHLTCPKYWFHSLIKFHILPLNYGITCHCSRNVLTAIHRWILSKWSNDSWLFSQHKLVRQMPATIYDQSEIRLRSVVTPSGNGCTIQCSWGNCTSVTSFTNRIPSLKLRPKAICL